MNFLDKAIGLAQHIALILPKYFLHNMDFSVSREKIKQLAINKIVDFGETGFKGVLIETICLFIDTQAVSENSSTRVRKSLSTIVPSQYQSTSSWRFRSSHCLKLFFMFPHLIDITL